MRWERARDLADEERAAAWYASLLDAPGFEIALWSNLQMLEPVTLGDVILVPTFVSGPNDPFDADPVVQATRRMYRAGRFLYDGWVPLDTPEAASAVVAVLEERLGVLALTGPHAMRWRPKYAPGGGDVYYALDPVRRVRAESFAHAVAELSAIDADAVRAALAALASVYRAEDPAAKLIFAVAAVQMLDRHAHRPPPGSIFTRLLSPVGIDHDTRVIAVLEGAIGPDHATVKRLRADPARLRNMRNKIAHGRLDPLSPQWRAQVASEAMQAAFVARVFVTDRLSRALGQPLDSSSPDQIFMLPQDTGVSIGPRSTGITHMALLYG